MYQHDLELLEMYEREQLDAFRKYKNYEEAKRKLAPYQRAYEQLLDRLRIERDEIRQQMLSDY